MSLFVYVQMHTFHGAAREFYVLFLFVAKNLILLLLFVYIIYRMGYDLFEAHTIFTFLRVKLPGNMLKKRDARGDERRRSWRHQMALMVRIPNFGIKNTKFLGILRHLCRPFTIALIIREIIEFL